MRVPLAIIVLLGLLYPAAGWPAGPEAGPAPAWVIDPAHCSVNFQVRHILAMIPGRFGRFAGTIRFDPDNLAGSLLDVSVEVDSVDTAVAKRDEDLRSPDYFDAARYPAMTFCSRRIEHKGDQAYVATGRLTIKDVTRDVELPFTYLGQKPNPLARDQVVAGFESRFAVNLLEFHVGNGLAQKLGAMGETAEVALHLELLR